jgi:peptidoglycan/xylan/chitin deacetylase (PgdA/CDA1 family)
MVLAYHGVRRGSESAAGTMHVSRANFDATTHAIGRVATYVPLRELVARHHAGRSTRGLVSVTFDDAYGSVFAEAWPTIVDQDVPVTVFVVLRGTEEGKPFWWDRMDEAFALASAARWRSFENECGLPDVYRSGQPASMGPLRPFRQWILAAHRGRWPASLDGALNRLEGELGSRPTQCPISFEELDWLAAHPLLDIGPHTVSHPVLPLLPDDEIRKEIRESFEALRSRYPRTVAVLSFPFGLYDERTTRIAREEGIDSCLTLEPRLLDDGSPDMIIPRIGISAHHQPWKTVLCALGCWRSARPRRRQARSYPDLPSAST